MGEVKFHWDCSLRPQVLDESLEIPSQILVSVLAKLDLTQCLSTPLWHHCYNFNMIITELYETAITVAVFPVDISLQPTEALTQQWWTTTRLRLGLGLFRFHLARLCNSTI